MFDRVLNIPRASIYLLKVIDKNSRTRYEICSKLTIKTLEKLNIFHTLFYSFCC